MIFFPQTVREEILRAGEKFYPNECCGVLFGELLGCGDKKIFSSRSLSNQFEKSERHHRFKIDAEIMLQLELEARRKKIDIVGFYHSHPDAPAVPSEYDRVHALPIYSYVIVSVIGGVAKNFLSWRLNDENIFLEEGIKIGDDLNSDDAQKFHAK